MKKAIGFLGGQFGDAVITLGIQKAFTDDHPDVHFTFALSKKYSAILPLFEGQPHIDDVYIWEGYDDAWPTLNDLNFIRGRGYDWVFNPMQRQDPYFYLKCHQVTSVCRMYGYRDPDSDKVSLVKNFETLEAFKDSVALCLFPNDGVGPKSLSVEKAAEIAKFVESRGLQAVQLGGANEPDIPGARRIFASYVDSAHILASSKFAVVGDTGFSWLASAYDIPVVGLYARAYYPSAPNCKNWQPVNEKAEYLEDWAAEGIDNKLIFDAIERKISND